MSEQGSCDAVVVGAGPNGLVAANALADAGWQVELVEANPTVGGAVRSTEEIAPGYVHDLFSAFYPLAAASPVIRGMDLQQHGLTWSHAPSVLSHALEDGRVATLHRDLGATQESLEAFAPGDGERWGELVGVWDKVRDPLLDALFRPLPPAGPLLRLLARTRVGGTLDLARLAVLPVRRMAHETFRGEGGGLLLTGNAMHADIPPDAAGSGIFGWLLAMLGQDVGFPVPKGGAQQLSDALARRFTSRGGQIRTGQRVDRVLVEGGRAVGVSTEGGLRLRARRAVVADVLAPTLYRDLVGAAHLPPSVARRLETFQLDHPTVKLNWALDAPVPWRNAAAAGSGTVHLGVDLDGFVDMAADISVGRLPRAPFVLFGQMTTADPTRSPAGTESAWGYSHLALKQAQDPDAVAQMADRMQDAVEKVAPGFGERVRARTVQSPASLAEADANLVDGAINGGTAALHQQLIFRPFTGTGRPGTPLPGLYLASASAHPGGGVHGACGWNAAQVALRDNGRLGALRRSVRGTVWERVLADQQVG